MLTEARTASKSMLQEELRDHISWVVTSSPGRRVQETGPRGLTKVPTIAMRPAGVFRWETEILALASMRREATTPTRAALVSMPPMGALVRLS